MKHTGIIIANLGSPDSFEVNDVRKYLREFLMDERVIDVPYLLRKLIVEGFVLPFRPKKSGEAYRSIWTDEGSPLVVNTKRFSELLKEQIRMPVEICMRYGDPKPENAVKKMLAENPELQKIWIIPMYPHYAMSSFETAVKHIIEGAGKIKKEIEIAVIPPYYADRGYIDALASSIKPYLNEPFDHLLFSYHGIPERHLLKTDPTHQFCVSENFECCTTPSDLHKFCYRHQIGETTKLVTQRLNLKLEQFSISFQSRLGKKWLTPYTDILLPELPSKGIKKLLVVCPAFTADCLETLEEIADRGKRSFLQAGGETFAMIPCMNVHEDWVKCVASWCRDETRFLKPKDVLAYEYKS